MEDLTKHQLILLVLLITFITSIGTSIISFTLLQEAPVEVTQNISRVVEKTVERVVTEEGEPEKVVTTVVVTEEDRVLDAIANNEASIVRLETTGADGSRVVSGIGLVISESGIVVSDVRSYSGSLSYNLRYYDGKIYSTSNVYVDSQNGLAFFKPGVPQNEDPEYNFTPATLGDSDTIKVGQTLVALSGRESNSVSVGRVRQLEAGDDQSVDMIISDINAGRATPGSLALNLSSEIIGMEAPVAGGETTYSYIPINTIKSAIPNGLEQVQN